MLDEVRQAGIEHSLDDRNRIMRIKLWSQRSIGELLIDLHLQGGTHQPGHNARPLLKELGISKDESSRFQKLARIPRKVFVGYLDLARAGRQQEALSMAGLLRLVEGVATDARAHDIRPYNNVDAQAASILPEPCQGSAQESASSDRLEELRDHLRLLDKLLHPVYASETPRLPRVQQEHIQRLIQQVTCLLEEEATQRQRRALPYSTKKNWQN